MQGWDLIRAFLALHRAGTFEGAAKTLAVDHSTLRRRIQTLEQRMGAPLFARNDGRYLVLPSMRPLLDSALSMEASSRLFFEGASGSLSGTVRVTMIDVFASWLAPDLARFRKQHPDIKLDITTEHHFVDLERELVDVAIRMARPKRGNARMRRLGEIRYAVYGAPGYLARHREQAGKDEGHDLLTLAVHFTHQDHEFLESEADWMLQFLPPGRVVCGTDSYLQLCSYCEADMGLTLLPEVLGDASERLVRLSDEPAAVCDLWLVVHSDTGPTQRVRQFVDFMAETFRQRLGQRPALQLVDPAA
jgi:DNA-binding transcriptional LysR family regulator